jgi:SAM-dependent methyltransferase
MPFSNKFTLCTKIYEEPIIKDLLLKEISRLNSGFIMAVADLQNIKEAIKSYWNKKIKCWSESSYDGAQPSGIIGRIFKRLRQSVDARLQNTLQILEPYVNGKSVLDIGCGIGLLGLYLIDKGCLRYTGIDISDVAIHEAQKKALAENKADKMNFVCNDIQEMATFPEADITVGLGLLDWISLNGIDQLMAKLKGRKILFTYSEQDNSPAELLHRIYLVKRLKWGKSGVSAYHYTRAQIDDILIRHAFAPVIYVKNRQMRFGVIFHNLHA